MRLCGEARQRRFEGDRLGRQCAVPDHRVADDAGERGGAVRLGQADRRPHLQGGEALPGVVVGEEIASRLRQRRVDGARDAVRGEAAAEGAGLGRVACDDDLGQRQAAAAKERAPGEERGARAVPERRIGAVDDRAGEAGEPGEGHGAKLGLHVGVVGRVPAGRLEPAGVAHEDAGDRGVGDVRVEAAREAVGVEAPRELGRRRQR